jgi:hypothetical protein
MMLRRIGPCTSEPTLQDAQVADLIEVELFPSMRCAAVTLAADLKTEQALDATSNAVVVRLDDSGASGCVDELDEMLAANCAHELVIHGFTAERHLREASGALRRSGVGDGGASKTCQRRAELVLEYRKARRENVSCIGMKI